ncbi:MAG: hypothetical protein DHS20C14_17720 [Phycisphaeraceae bacterium]|nr:MAG: hypothetical protein DHS20C14_17720 [Phycisphaeraceae bacterium]
MLATITMGLMLGASACATQRVSARHPEPEAFTFTWTTSDGDEWTHAALVERPDPGRDRGVGVALFSGGYATDLHWTVPGSYEHDGQRDQFTIDGGPTRDADALAAALVDGGFTVMRYSAIREGDPLHAEDPAMCEVRPFPETVAMANAAWGAMLGRAGLEPGEVFVLGHSLGGPRSMLASDGAAAGCVLLAGAYMTPNRTGSRALAEAAAGEPGEDSDGSGEISGWERAAATALRTGETRSAERLEIHGGSFEWASDVLARSEGPALAVWGGLDTISYHGPVLEHLLGDCVETVYFANLGHNLGPEDEHGRTGPIDDRVVGCVVGWLIKRAEAAP